MKFGRTIRRLREEKNISIARLARKVDMSPTYLAPIERDVFLKTIEENVPSKYLDMNKKIFELAK